MWFAEPVVALGEPQPAVVLRQAKVDRMELDRIDIRPEKMQEFLLFTERN